MNTKFVDIRNTKNVYCGHCENCKENNENIYCDIKSKQNIKYWNRCKLFKWKECILENFVKRNDLIKEYTKCEKGIVGKPRFNYNDSVAFYIKPYSFEEKVFFIGKVGIIDRYGTFEQNDEPSYDIFVDYMPFKREDLNIIVYEPCLVKHIKESELYFK